MMMEKGTNEDDADDNDGVSKNLVTFSR